MFSLQHEIEDYRILNLDNWQCPQVTVTWPIDSAYAGIIPENTGGNCEQQTVTIGPNGCIVSKASTMNQVSASATDLQNVANLEQLDTSQAINLNGRFVNKANSSKDSVSRINYEAYKPLRRYQCKTCGKCFRHPNHLTRHDVIHTGLRPYRCDRCGRDFNFIGNMIRHRKIHDRIHRCEPCQRTFKSDIRLQEHLERKKAKQERKKAKRDAAILRHLLHPATGQVRVLEPELQHQCQQGLGTFNNLDDSSNHVQNCGPSGDMFQIQESSTQYQPANREYRCTYCQMTFATQHDLSNHVPIHDVFVQRHYCQYCDMSFENEKCLEVHLLLHGEQLQLF